MGNIVPNLSEKLSKMSVKIINLENSLFSELKKVAWHSEYKRTKAHNYPSKGKEGN